jgi:hypothetical protein
VPNIRTCIKKAGKALSAGDAASIMEIQQDYIADGLTPTEASTKAVDEYLGTLQDERADIIDRAGKAGADIADLSGETRLARRQSTGGPTRVKGGKSKGRYVGSPGVNTPQALQAMRKRLESLAQEGSGGRYWYEESSDAIMVAVGGDRAAASQVAGILALYSPSTGVRVNTTNAMKSWTQFQRDGQVKNAGRFGSMDRAAQEWLATGTLTGGEKVHNFYNNLMRNIYNDPSYGMNEQGVTADIWMARAFGYHIEAPGPAQYKFIEVETARIASKMGWEPQQVQAAIWVAAKARIEKVRPEVKAKARKKGWIVGDENSGKEKIVESVKYRQALYVAAMKSVMAEEAFTKAGFSFADGMQDHVAQMSWEARPSTALTGVIPEIHAAPIEQHVEFQMAMSRALTNENGTDLLARELGLLTAGTIEGPAAWDMEISHGQQNMLLVPPMHKRGTASVVDPDAKAMTNAYADIMGLVLQQDGVAWHRPFYGTTQKSSNGIHVELEMPLGHNEAGAVYNAMAALAKEAGLSEKDARSFAPINTATGFRVLNFTSMDNKTFHKLVKQAAGESIAADGKAYPFEADGEIRENNWKENPNGEDYRRRIVEAGFGDTLRWAESTLAPRIREVHRTFAEQNGWTLPEVGPGGRSRLALKRAGGRNLPQVSPGRNGGLNAPPVRADGRLELTHYSRHGALTEIDPKYYGTASAGDERARKQAFPEQWVDRTYYGLGVGQIGGYTREQMLGNQIYTTSLAPADLYDFRKDPDHIRLTVREQSFNESLNTSIYEKNIQAAGYKGYWVNHPSLGLVAAVYEALPVETKQAVEPSNDPTVRFSIDREKLNRINADPTSAQAIVDKLGITIEEQIKNPKPRRTLVEKLKVAATRVADKTKSRTGVLATAPMMALPDFVRNMDTPQKYIEQVLHMDGFESELSEAYAKQMDPWLDLRGADRAQAQEMEDLMGYTTIWEMDPSKAYVGSLTDKQQHRLDQLQADQREGRMTAPKAEQLSRLMGLKKNEALRKKRWAIVTESWNGLEEPAQNIYKSIRDINDVKYTQLREAVEERIKELIPEGRTRKIALDSIREMYESGKVKGPYFPISRFGEFWGVVKEQVGVDQWDTLTFSKFENRSDMEDWVADMQTEFSGDRFVVQGDIDKGGAGTASKVNPRFAAEVIDKVRDGSPGRESLADEIWQMYLRSLPEQSARKHGMHRKGIAGFSNDALKSFAHHSFHTSKQISKVTWGHRLDATLGEMEKEARFNGDNFAAPLYQEFLARHQHIMDPNVNPLSSGLTSAGAHLWLGLLNIGSAGVNLTQNPLFGVARLSADHSILGADEDTELSVIRTMAKASKDVMRGYDHLIRDLSAEEIEDMTSAEQAAHIAERTAFKVLARRGLFEKTRAYDLTNLAERGESYVSGWRKAGEVSMKLFHITEQFNRHSAALAAFRLAKDRGMSNADATSYAEKATYDIHFNYSSKMRPRIAQGNIARVAFLFRNYSINAQARIWRDAMDSFDSLGSTQTAETKKLARNRLGKTLIASLLMAGVKGIPTVWGAMSLVAFLMADDDEYPDVQAAVRETLEEAVGREGADFVMHGPLDYLTGAQISSRVSLSDLWVRAPNQRDAMVPLSPAWAAYYAGEMTGPWGSYASDLFWAGQQLSEGETQRAFETVMPRSIANVAKAVRYATEGIETVGGQDVMSAEELSAFDVIRQGIGYSPSKVGIQWEINSQMKFQQAMRTNRETTLRRRMMAAMDSGDKDRIAEVDEEIKAFREKNPESALNRSSARKSYGRGKKASARSYAKGVKMTPKERFYWKNKYRLTPEEETADDTQ